MTHVEAFMNAEAEAQDEREREDDPVGYALRTGEIDHLSPADLRKYDELRADANEAAAAELESRPRWWTASYGNDGLEVEFFSDQLAYGRRINELQRRHEEGGWDIDSYTYGRIPT